MTIPASGSLSMTTITTEVGVPRTTSMNDVSMRKLAGKASGPISFSNFRGKTRFTFVNGNFADGTFPTSQGTSFSIPGWTIFNQQVKLNGLSTIQNRPTPNDSTPGTVGDSHDETGFSFSAELSSDLPASPTAGSRSVRLVSNGTSQSYGVVHGPYLVTTSTVSLNSGDKVSFWWKAEGGSDAYDIFAYLLNADNGSIIPLLNETGNSPSATTPWAKVELTIGQGQAGNYYFIFISGSFDYTGGQALGASLYVTMVDVIKP